MISLVRKRKRWPPIAFLCILATATNAYTSSEHEDAPPPIRSPVDCDFDLKLDTNGMCSWKPDQTGQNAIWHTGNSVLVDSANSIVKSSMGDDRFAFVQGHFGAVSEASLESQILRNAPGITNQLQFSYWKSVYGPILDVCLKKVVDSSLQCIDSISGAGAQQWTQRTLALPRFNEPFRIVFRARNIHSAEDLIGLDDIRLRMAEDELESSETSPLLTSTSPSKKEQGVSQWAAPKPDKKQPIQFSNFEMRRSQSKASVIQPAVQRSQPPIALDEQRLPIQDDDDPLPLTSSVVKPANAYHKVYAPTTHPPSTTTSTTVQPPPNILFHHHSPIPKKFESNFPDFGSFDDGHLTAPSPPLVPVTKMEDTNSCKAIKCSFLDTTCYWILGKSWKLGQGNIAIETAGEDTIRSGYFKAPLASFLEFDLWMSDDANIFIIQETQEVGMPGTDELSLFSRHGMANNGWHRFRVPLRPSFNSIRLKIRASLPNQNAFVTLSNTRLVNPNGEEANCETTPGNFIAPIENQWAAGIPLMNGVIQSGGLTTMSDTLPTTMTPFMASISPLATGTPPLTGNPFALPVVTPVPALEFMKNLDAGVQAFQQQQTPPSSPSMDGVTPIVPMRDNIGQRLTAFQKLPQQFNFPTLPPFPSLFDSPLNQNPLLPFMGQQPALTRPPVTSTSEPPPPDPFNDGDLVRKTTGQNSLALKELSENDAAFSEASETFARDNQLPAQVASVQHSVSANQIQDQKQPNEITRFLGEMANQPGAEQKLRQLAQQFGLDFDRLAGGKQLAALRKVLSAQRPLDLPASVGEAVGSGDTRLMKPIKPENVNEEDFERVIQQEAQRRLNGQAVSNEMLKKLAKLLNLAPSNPVDHDSPMARENLDFVFQNAMMNG